MTQSEARAAIVKATGEAILALPDALRAEAARKPFRFEVHLEAADVVDAVERPAATKRRRRK